MARVTDALLAAGKAAGDGQREQALEIAHGLRQRHHTTAKELVTAAQYAALGPEIEREFDTLDELLKGIVAVGELSPAQFGLRRQLRRAPQQPHRHRSLPRPRHSLPSWSMPARS